jgi:hypothetical protein
MPPNNAYSGKATLTGSRLVAIAIIVAALVLPDAAIKPLQAAKTENRASWTLGSENQRHYNVQDTRRTYGLCRKRKRDADALRDA